VAQRSRFSRQRVLGAIAVAAAALALSPVLVRAAEDGEVEAPPASADARWIDGARLRLAVDGASDVDHGSTRVSWLRGSGRLGLESRLSERWTGTLGVSFEYAAPDFAGDESFLAIGTGSGPTFDDLMETTLALGARRTLGKAWAIAGQAYLSARFERGADFGDALRGGVLFAVEYEPSERFEALLGVRVRTRLDRGVAAQPYVRLRWQIAPSLRLRLENADAQLELRMRDALHGFVYGAAHSKRYRLAERAGLPLHQNAGTLGVAGATGGLGLRWQASERVRWVGRVGAILWERLTVNDEHGDRIDRSSTRDAAFFARLELQTRL
jgi:hypothetical protein